MVECIKWGKRLKKSLTSVTRYSACFILRTLISFWHKGKWVPSSLSSRKVYSAVLSWLQLSSTSICTEPDNTVVPHVPKSSVNSPVTVIRLSTLQMERCSWMCWWDEDVKMERLSGARHWSVQRKSFYLLGRRQEMTTENPSWGLIWI